MPLLSYTRGIFQVIDSVCVPCIATWILNHWTPGEVPLLRLFFLHFNSCCRWLPWVRPKWAIASFFPGLLVAALCTDPVAILDTFQPGGAHLSGSYLFAILYSSWGSHSENTGVLGHCPRLQRITFCQNSSLWPVCLGWPYTKWPIASLSYASPFGTQGSDPRREYSLFVNCHFCVFRQQLASTDTPVSWSWTSVCACNMHSECTQLTVSSGRVRAQCPILSCLSLHSRSGAPSLPHPQESSRGLQSGLGWCHLFHLP